MPLGPRSQELLTAIRAAVEGATASEGTSRSALEAANALAVLLQLNDAAQYAQVQQEIASASIFTNDDALAQLSNVFPSSISVAGGRGSHSSVDLSRFQTFLAELLLFISKYPSVSILLNLLSDPGCNIDQGLVRGAYEAWAQVYSRAHLVFGSSDSYWFIPSLRWLSETLVSLGIKSDTYQRDPKQRNTTDSASRLSKSAGLAGNDRTPAPPSGEGTKRPAVMFLANHSFRAYFKLNNVRLCETVLSSVENAIKINRQAASDVLKTGAGGSLRKGNKKRSQLMDTGDDFEMLSAGEPTAEDLAYSGHTRADLVTYRYYLGRMRLHQHRLRAMHAFRTKAAIPLGRLPTVALLQSFDLHRQFWGIVQGFRLGAASATFGALDQWREWHRRKGTYLILREKLQIGLWRNLIRRSLILSRTYLPESTAPPNIKLSIIAATARLAWQDQYLDESDVECITTSLIDQ
ncbi:hypothetical protein OC846_004563, partial [Tilletia horrida]